MMTVSTPCEKSPLIAKVPQHVAIVMDGNRRWAGNRDLAPFLGHFKGSEKIPEITQAAVDCGVKVLTLYAFSTENWHRSPEEVRYLMEIMKSTLDREEQAMIDNGVRLHTIGNLELLPLPLIKKIESVKESTSQGESIDLVLAVNYGGRDDIVRAVKRVFGDIQSGIIEESAINEQTLSAYLDTATWPDPDLLIRTSGEHRVSNFLLWQISYAEVYITEVLWPDFTKKHLEEAIQSYQARDRRRGGC